jgi:two-component system, NtrC family, sensor kinase
MAGAGRGRGVLTAPTRPPPSTWSSILTFFPGGRGWLLSTLAVVAVFLTAAWAAHEERADALADFSHEQALLARAVGIAFEERLAKHLTDTDTDVQDAPKLLDDVVVRMLGGARGLEQSGELMLLVAPPDRAGFLTTDGRVIVSAPLRQALQGGQANIELPREEAVRFGLPPRRAMAGISRVYVGPNGGTPRPAPAPARARARAPAPAPAPAPWGLVVLASARPFRVREEHERWRLALTVVVVWLVVMAFARSVQRRQKRELELLHQVAVSSVEREHDASLAKADKMATLAALSTGIAHELGTPLGVIVGRVDQVVERLGAEDETSSPEPPRNARNLAALAIVLEQVERIQRIVRGSLALARGDSPTLERAPAAPRLRRAAELLRHRFESANVVLALELPTLEDEDSWTIACDQPLFEQALVNLLLNACQASSPRQRVVARLVQAPDEAHLTFVVTDQGAGISAEARDRATEPFFSTKRHEGGSGLGLTIVREIVHHHGGTFAITRRDDGPGTCATITLPLAR